ncbi:Protein of unknown function [Streptomyces sp. PAN_FS17]|nr:Protein of unknown function [Streptomyces sp. PAN_FS17]
MAKQTKKAPETSGRGNDRRLTQGDEVTWNSHDSTTEGTVEQKITRPTEAAGRTVDASPRTRNTRCAATAPLGPRSISLLRCARSERVTDADVPSPPRLPADRPSPRPAPTGQTAGRGTSGPAWTDRPGYGWRRHPAVRMWTGYEEALVRYGLEICRVWRDQGHQDSCAATLVADFTAHEPGTAVRDQQVLAAVGELPPWLGEEPFTRATARRSSARITTCTPLCSPASPTTCPTCGRPPTANHTAPPPAPDRAGMPGSRRTSRTLGNSRGRATMLTAVREQLGQALFHRVAGPDGPATRARIHHTPAHAGSDRRPIRAVHGDASMFIAVSAHCCCSPSIRSPWPRWRATPATAATPGAACSAPAPSWP